MDEKGLYVMAEKFFQYLGVINYSPVTIQARRRLLKQFLKWADQRGVTTASEVTREILEEFQRHIYYYRKKDGEALKFDTQRERLYLVKSFFHWLAKFRHIPFNPASEIELPLPEKRLPRSVLTAEEMEKVLRQPNLAALIGIRDRAILETFYSTGIRRAELIKLSRYDLDLERATLLIRQGKGKRDRLIPIGERALQWVKKYLSEVRPYLLKGQDSGHLFLSARGGPISTNQLSQLVRSYIEAAGVEKEGSCHMLRHTMATLMLEGGAELPYIQQILGHEAITSTQIYTRISIKKLQEVHKKAHPAQATRMKWEEGEG